MPRRPPNSPGQRRPPRPRAAATHSIIDELFAHPPVSRAELEHRLNPASVLDARSYLVQRLESATLEEQDGDLLVSIFNLIGVGGASQALLDLVADRRRDHHLRAAALTALLHADPRYSDQLRTVLPEEDLLSLAAQPLCQFLCRIEGDPEEAEQLALTLESVPEDLRLPLFEQLDQFRRDSGVPAAVAYDRVLRRSLLAELRPPILTALTVEGGSDAVALLEALRSESAEPQVRRNLQGLLLRLRTRELEGRTQPLGVTRAHLSSCDGQSAFFLLGERQNPDGSHTLALLCIRAAGDIRDGYVATRQPASQVRSLLSRFTTDAGTEFVEISLAQAAPIVEQALLRTQAERQPLPESAVPALRFFERVVAQPLPTVVRAGRLSLTSLRALLKRPAYRRAWFIDPGDLEASGIEPPTAVRPTASWLSRATQQLAENPAMVHRVVAMARHMAIWHQLRDETAAAGLCLNAAEQTEIDPRRSPLLRVLLEQLFLDLTPAQLAQFPAGSDSEPLGEPSRRQFLKSRFFLALDQPKGRDLALLDLTEAALLALERALDTVAGELRPREDLVQELAYDIGQLFREFVLRSGPAAPAPLAEQIATILRDGTRLPAAECHRLGLLLLSALVSFVDEVCGVCPVHCLKRPRSNFAAAFFSPMHPALTPTEPTHPAH